MDDAEMWKVHNERGKAKRAYNREASAQILIEAGVPFETKNSGSHLIIADTWNFWPGTGYWREIRGTRNGRGVYSLLAMLRKP